MGGLFRWRVCFGIAQAQGPYPLDGARPGEHPEAADAARGFSERIWSRSEGPGMKFRFNQGKQDGVETFPRPEPWKQEDCSGSLWGKGRHANLSSEEVWQQKYLDENITVSTQMAQSSPGPRVFLGAALAASSCSSMQDEAATGSGRVPTLRRSLATCIFQVTL